MSNNSGEASRARDMSREQKAVQPTNRVDLEQAGANMYGVVPCPQCKSVYRYPTQNGKINCDDCGRAEQAQENETDDA